MQRPRPRLVTLTETVERLLDEREQQGFPRLVTDPVALDNVATILATACDRKAA